jgi:hypothetical protein
MFKYIISASLLLTIPAGAENIWATGDCTLSNGGHIRYILHDGNGFITYGTDGPYEIFSKRDGNYGVITHIGERGNMVMSVDLTTGRAYIVTRFDDGRKKESNVSCRLGSVTQ